MSWKYNPFTDELDYYQAAGLGADSVDDTHIDWGTGAGQVSTADIPEQTNLYHTDERVDDRVAALLTAGNNIDLTYDDGANTLTVDVEALTSADLSDFDEAAQDAVGNSVSTGLSYDDGTGAISCTITQYTDELAQDAIGAMIDSSLTYVDGTPLLQRAALTGDVTASAGSNTTAIGSGVIVNADVNASAAIDWTKISKTGSDLADLATKSHTSLTDKGSNTHAQIDTHVGSTANPHSVTAAQAVAIVDGADTVDDTHIDWGTGADQVSAVDVPIADGGSIITGTEVETALQENRTAIDLNTTHKSSDGSDHTFIDQSVTSSASPTFVGVTLGGRLQGDKGADVASADEITLGTDGNYFDITGTTAINHITKTGWQAGSIVALQFDGNVAVMHDAESPTGTEASILLTGGAAFMATADDTLQLVYDGVYFREISRAAI